jgi:DNA-binding XRE family transcriptional regulator
LPRTGFQLGQEPTRQTSLLGKLLKGEIIAGSSRAMRLPSNRHRQTCGLANSFALCKHAAMTHLKTHLNQTGTSQAALACLIGVSRPYMSQLVGGTRLPSLPVARKIAQATRDAVPITSWPNIAAVVDAATAGAAS